MNCPIAYWGAKTPEDLAFPTYTYKAFNQLVSSLTTSLKAAPSQILAFIPQPSPLHIAFFFAAWRCGKTVYPLSHRLPKEAIEQRLQMTKACLITPETLSLCQESPIDDIDPNLIATFIETSSAKKIVCHRFESHIIAATEASKELGITQASRYALNLPLFHIAGIALVLRTFLKGAMVCFAIEEATHVSMVPTQLWRLVQNPSPLPQLKCLLVGGAGTHKTLYEQALSAKLPVYLTYGMTETSSIIAVKPPGQQTKVLPHNELKLASDGEILVQGPSLLHHYFGQPPHEGWFFTKDIGTLLPELIILGRKDRQFISGGENIQPEEIEQVLLTVPGILQARVDSKEDDEFGHVPIAYVQTANPQSIEQVQKGLELLLPRYKIPKTIHISSEPLKDARGLKMAQMDGQLSRDRD